MEFILWNRKEFDKIYNCSGINVDDIPIEKRQYPIAAIICIIFGFIYYPLYFPCIYSFWKNKSKNSCYILLIYISLMDIGLLWVPSFATGIMSLNGDVYCSSPFFTYFVGCIILFFWAAESTADLILGINRCIEMAFPNISKILFHGFRVYIWITFCNLFGIYWLLFCHPYIFNGTTFEYLFDPLSGYIPYRAEIFEENLSEIAIYNAILAVGSPTIYFLFIICLFFKAREFSNRVTKEELMVLEKNLIYLKLFNIFLKVFIQVFIISMLNTLIGIFYSYNIHHEDHGNLLLMIAHFSWLHIHGFPPVIYLTLNKTVRTDTKILIKKFVVFIKKFKNKLTLQIPNN